MARFLIVGHGEHALALAEDVRREGHAVSAVAEADRLGVLTGALEHVAIVCWLERSVSPERFLLAAIDSSMRGFVYQAGGWEEAVSEAARRNSIPAVAVRSDRDDLGQWLAEAREAIASLIGLPDNPRDTLC